MATKLDLVFQTTNYFHNLNVNKNCIEAPVAKKSYDNKEGDNKKLKFTKTNNLLDKKTPYPKTLSGGQQQRASNCTRK